MAWFPITGFLNATRTNALLESGGDRQWPPMGFRHLATLLDIAKAGYFLRLTCSCGHSVRLDPMKVLERLARRGADTRLNRLSDTLKCGQCGGKGFRATHCEGPEIWSDAGPKDHQPRSG